jgi:hypothetical protein
MYIFMMYVGHEAITRGMQFARARYTTYFTDANQQTHTHENDIKNGSHKWNITHTPLSAREKSAQENA